MGKTYKYPNKTEKIKLTNKDFSNPNTKKWVRRKPNKFKDDLYD